MHSTIPRGTFLKSYSLKHIKGDTMEYQKLIKKSNKRIFKKENEGKKMKEIERKYLAGRLSLTT